jgi:imidazolonepropionase-like amidohydrolase
MTSNDEYGIDMGLLIRGGEIVTNLDRYFRDIYVEGEFVTEIGTNIAVPSGTEVIDATGKLIFPGFIDPHVHIHLPFMGTFAKDDYKTASTAALSLARGRCDGAVHGVEGEGRGVQRVRLHVPHGGDAVR